MRLSFDALSGLIESRFGQNPLNGHLFVFFSKQRDRMKVLFWDLDGFVLYYKRLEAGTFGWLDDAISGDNPQITSADLALLLVGINPQKIKKQKRFQRAAETCLA
jgi:transposase